MDKTGQIIELEDPDNEFGDFNSTGVMFDMLQRAVSHCSLLFVFHMIVDGC